MLLLEPPLWLSQAASAVASSEVLRRRGAGVSWSPGQ